MKLSDLNWKWWVLFLNQSGDMVHSCGFEELPNVATLTEIFGELRNDPDFEIDEDIDDLQVIIVTNKQYIGYVGNLEFEDED